MKTTNFKKTLLIILTINLTSCAIWKQPITQGDPQNANNYGYHPMDPLPVEIEFAEVNKDNMTKNSRILNALPDETMRLAVGQLNKSGGISFGTATTGYKGNQYVVVLDYIKFNTKPFGVTLDGSTNKRSTDPLTTKASNADAVVLDYIKFNIKPFGDGSTNKRSKDPLTTKASNADVIVPVYIGVGLRLTANITVSKGEVNLGNLFAIGGEASSEKISGTLVVQTLGISGKTVSTSIPMPSEINSTTIQNAILALGTIKAVMYENDTKITPRVVGVYNNLGGGTETINKFISSILQEPNILHIE